MSFTFSWGHAHIYNHIAQVYPQPWKNFYASSFILNNPWTNNTSLLKYTDFFTPMTSVMDLILISVSYLLLKIICPPRYAVLSWSWWIPIATSFGVSSPTVCEQSPWLLSILSGHSSATVSHRRCDPLAWPWQHSPGAHRQECKERTWEHSGSPRSPGHTRAANTSLSFSRKTHLSVSS